MSTLVVVFSSLLSCTRANTLLALDRLCVAEEWARAPNNAVASHISILAVSMSLDLYLYLYLWRWYGLRLCTRHFLSEAQPHFFPSSFLSKCPWTVFACFFVESFVCLLAHPHSLVRWHILQPLSLYLHLRCAFSLLCHLLILHIHIHSCSSEKCNFQLQNSSQTNYFQINWNSPANSTTAYCAKCDLCSTLSMTVEALALSRI